MSNKLNDSSIILGVDVGTTCCKCTAFGADFEVLAEVSREYPLIYTAAGMVEQDPEVWWNAVFETISEAVHLTARSGSVAGIGVSSQGISFVPVDSDGHQLMNAITWLDMRASKQCGEIRKAFGDEFIYKTTGKRINPAYTLPKIMWLKENVPDVYENTYKFLTAHDYIINRLCGAFVTEDSLAAGTMAYDITNKRWHDGILAFSGVGKEKLPEVYKSGSVTGNIKRENAINIGLPENTVVSTGGQDQKCAAFGSGLSYDCITVSLGTSCAITSLFDSPVFPDDMSLPCFPYIDGRSWVLEGFGSTAGAAIKWFRDNMGNGRSYNEIDNGISVLYKSNMLPDSVVFFPYLGGTASPEWFDAKGGGFVGLTLDTSNDRMAAAVLESIAFNIKANIDKMESLGKVFSEISVFGGGANSEIWLEIISDVTGKKVRVPYLEESACLGAAMKCAQSLGYPGVVKYEPDRIIFPDSDKNKIYINKYIKYKELENKIFGGAL